MAKKRRRVVRKSSSSEHRGSIGGDGFNDRKKVPQARVDAVTRACIQALKPK